MTSSQQQPHPVANNDQLEQFFAQGGALRMLSATSAEDLAQLASYASQLFAAGDYAAARNIYVLLTTLDHRNHEYLLGLGLCHQRLNAHHDALDCFTRAGVNRVADPRAAFFAGLSLRLLGCESQAHKAFKAAVMTSGQQTEFQEIKESAKRMLGNNKEAA